MPPKKKSRSVKDQVSNSTPKATDSLPSINLTRNVVGGELTAKKSQQGGSPTSPDMRVKSRPFGSVSPNNQKRVRIAVNSGLDQMDSNLEVQARLNSLKS